VYPTAPEDDPRPYFSTRSRRRVRMPKHYKDFLPSSATPLSHMPNPIPVQRQRHPQPPSSAPPSPPQRPGPVPATMDTEPNEFGIYRSYTKWPTVDPEDAVSLEDICDSIGPVHSNMDQSATPHSVLQSPPPIPTTSFAPFLNATVFRLMNWWYDGGNTKSAADLDRLVNDVLLQDDFDQSHLQGFSASRETKRLDNYGTSPDPVSPSSKGWRDSTVKIRLPGERVKNQCESQAPNVEISGLYHRSLLEIIQDAFQDPVALTYHLTPFKLFRKRSNGRPAERLFGEAYTSDAMLEEYGKICASPGEPGCNLERVVVPLMIWSDSTHLASFGTASLWPIYVFFGNQSKYVRARPKSFACHHLAYIPSVCYILFYI
jgi:hypothetical protein